VEAKELQGLDGLHTLKLGNNRLSSYGAVAGVIVLAESLTYLDLSGNESLDYDPLMYSELLSKMKITVLSLQRTLMSRSVPSYRKTTINAIQSLLFLDEKPVTEEERLLVEAWTKGGIVSER
jgi:Leucine-rich repeat (LRR) protein